MNNSAESHSVNGIAEHQNRQPTTPALTLVAEEPHVTGVAVARPAQTSLRRNESAVLQGSNTQYEYNDERRDRAVSTPAERPSIIKRGSGLYIERRMTVDDSTKQGEKGRPEVLKLSAAQIDDLTRNPESLPMRQLPPLHLPAESDYFRIPPDGKTVSGRSRVDQVQESDEVAGKTFGSERSMPKINGPSSTPLTRRSSNEPSLGSLRPRLARALSAEESAAAKYPEPENHRVFNQSSKPTLASAFDEIGTSTRPTSERQRSHTQALPSPPPSPRSETIPLPPFSMPTYLHLELSADRPSPLYVHQSLSGDLPYEPSRVRFERLLNFLLLPLQLERVLFFGALTCLDAWLYSFTILPLRFFKALWILIQWASGNVWEELRYVTAFIYEGSRRVWSRWKWDQRKDQARPDSKHPDSVDVRRTAVEADVKGKPSRNNGTARLPSTPEMIRADSNRPRQHKPSAPSLLKATHKADLLQGLLIICTCTFLMQFDASRIYHGIRGQSAVKLYVIYNMLEVCDRLFSAIGQDIIECLFSPETLERKPNGRSNIITPFWMFLIALVYTIFHAGSFLYQVITLNVAVNSYSNALLTLLLSNQFVEIKGAVFKKFEKENLFQLTCADVVERFQLWLMLLIIALRNLAELGGLSIAPGSADSTSNPPSSSGPLTSNATAIVGGGRFSILPHSFTLIPLPTGAQLQPLTPFLLVLSSEMLVDWLKHAYITKFNAYKPRSYARFLDVLAKDYYSNAFGSHNIVRRLGLPVIPLACLFIRATLQTYHMFLATNVTPPPSLSTSTSLALDEATSTASPALAQIDHIFRNALGRSSFGGGASSFASTSWFTRWTLDDVIALTTMIVFFLAVYVLLLALKLVLSMVLLSVARKRYRGMEQREREKMRQPDTKRVGGWGTVELGEERRKVIYEGDEKRLEMLREKESKARQREEDRGGTDKLDTVNRYAMVAKRIW